jgi:hypothetical protein
VIVLVVLVDVAGAEIGAGAVFAVVSSGADAFAGGKFVAVGSQLRGLDGFVFIEGLLAIDELRGNLDPVEKGGGFLEVDAFIDDGVVDAGDGELNGGGIFRRGQLQGSEPEVGLGAYSVGLVVVVAETCAREGRGLAAEPVGLDVAANHVHFSTLPPPSFSVKSSLHEGCILRGSRKRLIANGLNCKVVKKNDLAELAVFARPILAATKSVVISGI